MLEGPKRKTPAVLDRRCEFRNRQRSDVFGRPGSDLLSQALRLSTIGATGFNGRVRDGIGFWAPRNYHQIGEKHSGEFWFLISVSRSPIPAPVLRAWSNE